VVAGFAFLQTNQNEVNYLFLLPLVAFAVKHVDDASQAPKRPSKHVGEEKTHLFKQNG